MANFLLITVESTERSAISHFIEKCANYIGFDVWDWCAFVVAIVSLYVALVTLKSQRHTEKNTQALLTLDGQLLLFQNLFLQLYRIQEWTISCIVKNDWALDLIYSIRDYKEGNQEVAVQTLEKFGTSMADILYLENKINEEQKELEGDYMGKFESPYVFSLPLQNIHQELFYNNESLFLLVNGLYSKMEKFNQKYEYKISSAKGINLLSLAKDVAKLASETRTIVKEIFLLNTYMERLENGILHYQSVEYRDGVAMDNIHYSEELYHDYGRRIEQLLLQPFGLKKKQVRRNALHIILQLSDPCKYSLYDPFAG